VLAKRTNDYQNWVEAFARNHSIPIEWAQKGVRKEDHVLPWLRRMRKKGAYGVYFIPVSRSIRLAPSELLEVLLQGGNSLGGWTAKHIHQVVLESFQLSEKAYGLNQLRYDLHKLKAHSLLQREASRYASCLNHQGIQVALLLFSHKRLCGPLANSRFHSPPGPLPSAPEQTRSYVSYGDPGHRRSPRCRLIHSLKIVN
jgi:hypothetical protein